MIEATVVGTFAVCCQAVIAVFISCCACTPSPWQMRTLLSVAEISGETDMIATVDRMLHAVLQLVSGACNFRHTVVAAAVHMSSVSAYQQRINNSKIYMCLALERSDVVVILAVPVAVRVGCAVAFVSVCHLFVQVNADRATLYVVDQKDPTFLRAHTSVG